VLSRARLGSGAAPGGPAPRPRRSRSASRRWPRSPGRWGGRSTFRGSAGWTSYGTSAISPGSPNVGLRDVLFGRKKLKPAQSDRIFALSTAAVTLDTELGLTPAGSAGVVFKPLSAGDFVRAENELQELLDVAARDSQSKVDRKTDDMGYEWIIVRDDELEDLVTTVHLIDSQLKERGFGEQLLAAIFPFKGYEHPVYWIYGYKRGAFWPFVPT